MAHQAKTAGEIESPSATTAANDGSMKTVVWFSTLEELERDRSLFRSKDSLIQLRKAKKLEKLGHGLVHNIKSLDNTFSKSYGLRVCKGSFAILEALGALKFITEAFKHGDLICQEGWPSLVSRIAWLK